MTTGKPAGLPDNCASRPLLVLLSRAVVHRVY